jgi:hypothetical protein
LIAVYLVVFGVYACLFPLAFYFLVLASWNKRRRPLLINGPADFAGTLLATSGFLIVGGPLILWGLYEHSRRSGQYPSFAAAWEMLGATNWPWLAVWLAYLLVVGGGALRLLARRKSIVIVYHIAGEDAARLVDATLEGMGLTYARRGTEYWIESPQRDGLRRAIIDVRVSPVLRTVTLCWVAAPGKVRQEIEAEIRAELAEIASPPSRLSGWFLTFASGLFAVMILVLGWFVALVWRLRG